MAIFKSQVLTQASGSVGGMTYTRTRSGMTLRARAMPVNPSTPYQQEIRSYTSAVSQRWQTVLDDWRRQGWTNYANAIARTNKLGDTIYLTGQQMYLRCNVPRLQAGIPLSDDAPPPFAYTLGEPADLLTAATVVNTEEEAVIRVTWGNVDPNAFVAIYASRPMAPTRIFFKGPYRYNGAFAASIATADLNNALLPLPIGTGLKVVLQARVIYIDGRVSDATQISLIATEDILGPDTVAEGFGAGDMQAAGAARRTGKRAAAKAKPAAEE